MTLTEATVGQLVVTRPARARIFERYGIDYCCGGKKLLTQACEESGVDVQMVLEELHELDHQPPSRERDWSQATLTELAAHIEATHHAYLKQELPRLDFLTEKVADVHGPNDPRLVRLRQIFIEFRDELVSHMMKEEQVLFPMCRQLDHATETPRFHCGSVQNPIRMMVFEHDNAGHAMDEFRMLTDDYTPPAEACNTYRALLDGLATLEKDMHQHVHKENNIMFPKAVEMEARLASV